MNFECFGSRYCFLEELSVKFKFKIKLMKVKFLFRHKRSYFEKEKNSFLNINIPR